MNQSLHQIAFITGPKKEGLMLIVMKKITQEENFIHPEQESKKQPKTSINFFTG